MRGPSHHRRGRPPTTPKTRGAQLRKRWREEAGLSQHQLAELAPVGRSRIAAWEQRCEPSLAAVIAVVRVLQDRGVAVSIEQYALGTTA